MSIMDGYSRKIQDWELCGTKEGVNIELLVARVKEKHPEAHARVIHDNGKQKEGTSFILQTWKGKPVGQFNRLETPY